MAVETNVREHLRANDVSQDTIDWDEIVARSKTGVVAAGGPPARSRGVLVFAAAMVILILIGVVPWLLRSSEEPTPITQPPPTPTTVVTPTTVPEATPTPTTVPDTTPTTVPLPAGREVALTSDELTMLGVLLEAAETADSSVRISVNADGAEGANNLGAVTFEDANARIDVWRFDSEALAGSFVEDWVRTLTDGDASSHVNLPAPQGWDQSVAIGEPGGRFPSRIIYLVRSQEWVLMREIAGLENEDLGGTQALADAVFGAVDSEYSPSIVIFIEELPSLPDSYVAEAEIIAPLPGYGDGEGESEFQGLAWGTEYTQRDSQPAICTTWHVPLGEVEPTVWDSFVPQSDGTIRWTTMGPDFERTTAVIAGDNPTYLTAFEECTRYPVDATGWGLQLPDDLPPGLDDLTPVRLGEGQYFAQDVASSPHEFELDPSQVAALGWIDAGSDIEVVSAVASLARDGLSSIYVDLRGSTAALGEHFGIDLSDLGSGPVDVAFSIETVEAAS